MMLLDVNVLIYAHRAEMAQHPATMAFVQRLLNGGRTFGIPQIVFSGLIRIVTQRPFDPPSSCGQAVDFCNGLIASPRCLLIQPGENHWAIFTDLCKRSSAHGKAVADAYLAAFAIEREAEWITADRDFGRFPGLTWRHPLAGSSITNPR